MKNQIYVLLGLFLFFGCNKDQIEKDSIGEFSALKNGEPWMDNFNVAADLLADVGDPENSFKIVSVKNCPDTTIFVSMQKVIKSDFEHLTFITGLFRTGKFSLIDITQNCRVDNLVQASFDTSIGGDVSGKSYDLLTSDDNHFSIKSIDRNKNLVTGEFQIAFININDDADTVRFTEGIFQTSIIQPPSP